MGGAGVCVCERERESERDGGDIMFTRVAIAIAFKSAFKICAWRLYALWTNQPTD